MDTMLLFPLGREGDRRLADREVRAVVEPHALDAPPVHLRAVRRAEVDEPVRRALLHDLCVTARNVRILDPDVGVARPAEHRALLVEDAPLATPAQHRDLPLHPELDGRGGLGRLDVRAESAAEDAFEDTLQPLLDSPQHHYDAAEGTPRAGARSAVTAAIAQAASSRGSAAALGTAATVSTIIPAPSAAAAHRPRARACGRASATSARAQVSSRSAGCAPAARASEPATSDGSRPPAAPGPSGAGPPTRGSATCRIPAASAAVSTPSATM